MHGRNEVHFISRALHKRERVQRNFHRAIYLVHVSDSERYHVFVLAPGPMRGAGLSARGRRRG
jgi:hypothetical protein